MATNELKELRKKLNLTQEECADILGISLISYWRYENEQEKSDDLKYLFYVRVLKEILEDQKSKRIWSINEIAGKVRKTLEKHPSVKACILIGNYADNLAMEDSPIELILVGGEIIYIEIKEIHLELETKFHKTVTISSFDDVINDKEFVKQVLIKGKKIYKKSQV